LRCLIVLEAGAQRKREKIYARLKRENRKKGNIFRTRMVHKEKKEPERERGL